MSSYANIGYGFSFDGVLSYLLDHEGAVKNEALVNVYKEELSHPNNELREMCRKNFQEWVHTLARQKMIDGERHLFLKKMYMNENSSSNENISEQDLSSESIDVDCLLDVDSLTKSDSSRADSLNIPSRDRLSSDSSCEFIPALIATTDEEIHVNGNSTKNSNQSSKETLASKENTTQKDAVSAKETAVDSTDSKFKEEEEDEEEYRLTPAEKEWHYIMARAKYDEVVDFLNDHKEDQEHFIQFRSIINGFTVLHYAIQRKNKKLITDLLNKGADPNVKTYGGFTALHKAAMCDCGIDEKVFICNMLVRGYGTAPPCKIGVRDNRGRKPSQLLDRFELSSPQLREVLGGRLPENESLGGDGDPIEEKLERTHGAKKGRKHGVSQLVAHFQTGGARLLGNQKKMSRHSAVSFHPEESTIGPDLISHPRLVRRRSTVQMLRRLNSTKIDDDTFKN